jgi:hypothetical protein
VRRTAALLALVLLVVGGCGGGEGSSDGGDSAIDLTVTLWPSGVNGDSATWQLQCEPTGGDHPDPTAACAALTAVKDPFGPVPPPPRCKEIPESGPEVAVVEGTFRGRAVRSTFSRASACVTPRWDRIAPVFPAGF